MHVVKNRNKRDEIYMNTQPKPIQIPKHCQTKIALIAISLGCEYSKQTNTNACEKQTQPTHACVYQHCKQYHKKKHTKSTQITFVQTSKAVIQYNFWIKTHSNAIIHKAYIRTNFHIHNIHIHTYITSYIQHNSFQINSNKSTQYTLTTKTKTGQEREKQNKVWYIIFKNNII